MKTKILIFSLIILTLSLSFVACEQQSMLSEEVLQASETPTMELPDIQEADEYSPTLIATIQKDGHEIKFSTSDLDDNQGIGMEESLYGEASENGEAFYLDGLGEGTTPYDVFVRLTDETVAIPKSIAASAKDNQLAVSGRMVQENDNPVELLDANYTVTENLESRNCYGVNSTDIGRTPFVMNYCRTPQNYEIRFCDPNDNFGRLDRFTRFNGSWQKHRNARVWMNNTCGYVKIHFYSWSSSERKWKYIKTKTSYGHPKRFTHWQSNLAELAVVAIPQYSSTPPLTLFRMETQFVR